ncbi:MAG: IS3 family transposase [Bacteroidota bacterium]
MGKKRRTFSSRQKSKIALEALQERKTGAELAKQYGVHPNQVSQWKKQALSGLEDLFRDHRLVEQDRVDQEALISRLYEQVGKLQVELDWLKKKLASCNRASLRSLVGKEESGISIKRQCELLGLSRSSYYYEPIGESEENLLYMRLMDEQYLDTPYYGVGQMTFYLRQLGYQVNPKRVRRLLRLMGLEAICPGPHTSKPSKSAEHQVFPYLLRDLKIVQCGQVVGTDITYIPMRSGFLYLVAFMDWYSRYVLSWELSNTLETSFCLTALEQIWDQIPVQIINTDQGSQFTSQAFVQAVLKQNGVRLSMDGKGRCMDNIFTERLWRSVKYEEVYLKSYEDGHQTWQSLNHYFKKYNELRPHKSLGGKTPHQVFEQGRK